MQLKKIIPFLVSSSVILSTSTSLAATKKPKEKANTDTEALRKIPRHLKRFVPKGYSYYSAVSNKDVVILALLSKDKQIHLFVGNKKTKARYQMLEEKSGKKVILNLKNDPSVNSLAYKSYRTIKFEIYVDTECDQYTTKWEEKKKVYLTTKTGRGDCEIPLPTYRPTPNPEPAFPLPY